MSRIRIDRFNADHMIAYIPEVNGKAKDLPKLVHGNRWNKRKGGWVYPLDWQICEEIRRLIAEPMGARISLTPAMMEWAWAEKAKRDGVPDILSTEDYPVPTLERVNPKLFAKARPFQRRGMAFIAKTGRVLLAYDPGLGKTATAIGGVHERDLRGLILVIAPSTAVNISWPLELKQWGVDDYIQIIGAHIPPRDRDAILEDMEIWAEENPDKRCWILLNPYWIRMSAEIDEWGKYVRDRGGAKVLWAELPRLFKIKWAAIIADESHQTLACKTGNAKRWSQQRVGLGALQHREDGILMSISGTPMRGLPENLFGQLTWLKPQVYKSYWKWIKRHYYVFTDPMGDAPPEIGTLKDPKKFYEEASNVLIRLSKEEVAPDLPPKQYGGSYLDPNDESTVYGVWLPLEGKQKRSYDQMAQHAEAQLEGHILTADGRLAEYTRLKQFAGSYIKFAGWKTRKEISEEWYAWKDMREEIANLIDLKAAYREEGAEAQADLIFVPELPDEPDKYTGREFDDEPIYEAMLPSNKFDWILQFLIDRDLVGKQAKGAQKVIIASQFTRLINLFSKELERKGVPNYKLTGETKQSARLRMVEDFQMNPDSPKVFFLNTKAGGTAITLDAADDVIICDETFVPDDQLQVEDRAHRLSNTEHQVTIWYLRSLGTLEEGIGATTTEREANCKGILDGSRGLSTVKLRVGKR